MVPCYSPFGAETPTEITMKSPIRLFTCAVALAAWMLLLFVGWTLGGAIHLLLIAALVAFPWREVRT